VDLRSRWPLDEALYQDLVARYREPHRRYHTLQHLEECFARFDELRALAEHPRDVELAIWFHDAIYDTRRSDNEARSAAWGRSVAGEYEAQVREEYGWVPALIYRRKRRQVLESIAARPTIYNTAAFVQRYEKQARENLARSLARR